MKHENIIRNKILQYAIKTFETSPEHLWIKYPNYVVLRHKHNSKWYAVIMDVPKEKLGIQGDGRIDILNVKCDSVIIDSLLNKTGFFPAYHMNKKNWITIILDGSVSIDEILNFLNLSFDITKK